MVPAGLVGQPVPQGPDDLREAPAVSTDQLRKHLAHAHDLPLHGVLPYARLLAIHQSAHRDGQDHDHDHAADGDG